MDHIVIVQGHPEPAGGDLCPLLVEAYAEGALAAGRQVSRVEIAELDFPLLPSIHDAKLPNELRRAATTLLAATHIVLVLPLWYGKLPLKMSAFVRQVIRPSSVFQFGKKRVPLELEGRSCRIIVLEHPHSFIGFIISLTLLMSYED